MGFCSHRWALNQLVWHQRNSMGQCMAFWSSCEKKSATLGFNSNLSQEDEDVPKSAISDFGAKEEENEKEKLEVREKDEAHTGPVEEETKRLSLIRGNNDDKTIASKSILLCCKFFVSEARNREALDAIERAASLDSETVVTKKFEDHAYNRTRYTLVSYVVHDSTGTPIYSPLQQTVMAMVEAAYASINLELHTGGHPRLGVVDDIVFHPLARASLDDAAWLAKGVAANIASIFQVPVYLYAAAHPTGKALETIRREMGFYQPNFKGNQWAGGATSEILQERPSGGPAEASTARGVVMIGARPWIGTYNIPLKSTNISTARRIARMVSARGGGLPTVQSLGLFHGDDSTEIACMLLNPKEVGADMVQNRVETLAAQEGLEVGKGYFTDFSQEMTLEKYMNSISAKANK